MFYDKNGNVQNIEGTYDGQSVFVFGGGRSITIRHIDLAKTAGIVTASLNEGAHYIRPNIYMSTSGITMPLSLLSDPTVHKFIRFDRRDKKMYEDRKTNMVLQDYPNISWFNLKLAHFDKFLDPSFVYSQKDTKNYMRNSAMTLINILVKLGFTDIYLVGMDFYDATDECTYFYERDYINKGIDKGKVRRVKKTLAQLNDLPNVNVYNTNPRSGLANTFPFVDFEEAIERCKVDYEADIHDTFNDDRLVWGWEHYMGIDKSHIKK